MQAAPEQAMAGVKLWQDWAAKLGASLLDPGAPFGRVMKVSAAGAEPMNSDVVGMSILSAASMEDALAMVEGHHHLAWAPGCSILVQEEITIPEMG